MGICNKKNVMHNVDTTCRYYKNNQKVSQWNWRIMIILDCVSYYHCKNEHKHLWNNVDNGVDTEAIKKYYLHEYEEKSIRNCSNCWALRLCDICYADCYDQNGINVQMKAGYCEEVRERYKSWLIKYYETIENNIDLVKKIDDIEFN